MRGTRFQPKREARLVVSFCVRDLNDLVLQLVQSGNKEVWAPTDTPATEAEVDEEVPAGTKIDPATRSAAPSRRDSWNTSSQNSYSSSEAGAEEDSNADLAL